MKIVGNYVSNNSIKAVTIEESKEKLVIMEKASNEMNPGNLVISEVSSICDVQVKKEPDSSDGPDVTIPDITIKKEPQDIEEVYELPDNNAIPHTTDNLENNIIASTESEEKLDVILNLNKEILEIVKSLKHLNDQKNDVNM